MDGSTDPEKLVPIGRTAIEMDVISGTHELPAAIVVQELRVQNSVKTP